MWRAWRWIDEWGYTTGREQIDALIEREGTDDHALEATRYKRQHVA